MSQISAFGGRITVDKPDFYFSPTESYGILGWMETAIMILAGVAGVISLFNNPSTDGIAQRVTGSHLGEGSFVLFLSSFFIILNIDTAITFLLTVVIIGLLLLWYLATPVFRFFEGEIFALIFSFYVIVCHVFLFFGALFAVNPVRTFNLDLLPYQSLLKICLISRSVT